MTNLKNIEALAQRVNFTEQTEDSMRALIDGKYIGTIVRNSNVDEETGEELVIWGWMHDRNPEVGGTAETRRAAVVGLLNAHVTASDDAT